MYKVHLTKSFKKDTKALYFTTLYIISVILYKKGDNA